MECFGQPFSCDDIDADVKTYLKNIGKHCYERKKS